MSRIYRVKVSETVTREVHVEDGVQVSISVLGILSEEEMSELLEAALEERGFERQEGGELVQRREDGIEIEIDVPGRRMTIRLAESEQLELDKEVEGQVIEELATIQEQALRDHAKAGLEVEADLAEAAMREAVTRRLSEKLPEIHQEVERAITAATGEALKRRASQLGEVEEVIEDPETGAIRIRVKV